MKTHILIMAFFIFTTAWAQPPHTFTQTAHINDGGIAVGLAVGLDGTVFLANGSDGLRAYNYDGASFTSTAHIIVGSGWSYPEHLTLGLDGTVFVVHNPPLPPPGTENGLRAYTYDDTSFTNTAHIHDGRYALDVAVGPDSTIFVAYSTDGLRAYTYHDTSFTNTAHIDSGSFAAQGVAVGPDGTIFVACGDEGLRAYSYDDTSFTNTTHIDDGGEALGVAIGPDGTVFLANYDDGLRAYSYDDTSFTNTAHIDDGGHARRIAIGPDGTVFLANYDDGLRAYSYNGTSFTNTAFINNGDLALDVAVDSDGTIFLANGDMGLYAYTYSGYTAIKNQSLETPVGYSLHQNYPNPFNPTTTIEFALPQTGFVSLKVYNILGEEVATLVSEKLAAGNYKYDWDASGLASGVYLYRLQAGDYVETRKMVLLR